MTDAEMREITGKKPGAKEKLDAFLDSKLARAVGPTLGRIVENHGAEGLRGLGIGPAVLIPIGAFIGGALATAAGYLVVTKATGNLTKTVSSVPERIMSAVPFVGAGLLTGFTTRYYAPNDTIKRIGQFTTVGLVGIGTYKLFIKKADAKTGKIYREPEKYTDDTPYPLLKDEVGKNMREAIFIELRDPGIKATDKDEPHETWWLAWLGAKQTKRKNYVVFPVVVENRSSIQRGMLLRVTLFSREAGQIFGMTKDTPFHALDVPAADKKIVGIKVSLDAINKIMKKAGNLYAKVYAYSPLNKKDPALQSKAYSIESILTGTRGVEMPPPQETELEKALRERAEKLLTMTTRNG